MSELNESIVKDRLEERIMSKIGIEGEKKEKSIYDRIEELENNQQITTSAILEIQNYLKSQNDIELLSDYRDLALKLFNYRDRIPEIIPLITDKIFSDLVRVGKVSISE